MYSKSLYVNLRYKHKYSPIFYSAYISVCVWLRFVSLAREKGASGVEAIAAAAKILSSPCPYLRFSFLFCFPAPVFFRFFASAIWLSACAYATLFGTFRNAWNVSEVGHVWGECFCVACSCAALALMKKSCGWSLPLSWQFLPPRKTLAIPSEMWQPLFGVKVSLAGENEFHLLSMGIANEAPLSGYSCISTRRIHFPGMSFSSNFPRRKFASRSLASRPLSPVSWECCQAY